MLQSRLDGLNPVWDRAQETWERELLRAGSDAGEWVRDARSGGTEWRYTIEAPDKGWELRDFDDRAWKVGKSGFGSKGTPNAEINTEWTTSDIWMRTTFSVSQIPDTVYLHVQHDEDARVFLNGKLVAELKGYTTGSETYEVVALGGDGLPLITHGENSIAVTCHQTSGGQFIDVGLSLSKEAPDSELNRVLRLPVSERKREERGLLRDAGFVSRPPKHPELRNQIASAKEAISNLTKDAPTMLATVSVEPRTMRILPRGNWMDDSGEIVEPAIPAMFHSEARPKKQRTRLDLANWVTARDNPLTARVFVNRLWKLYFGTGLSKVLDDVGAQGEAPSHPELLDALAVEFMDSGWDIKHVIKLIMMSHSYRQSSLLRPELMKADPYNRLLARQSRFRLDAEMIRDNALSVSGLLVRRMGGASVKPYQPAGYWEASVFSQNAPTSMMMARTSIAARSTTHWQRQFLHPAMKIFDASPREECVAERPRSNTPLGALALLNDPSQVEAARALVQTLLRREAPDATARLQMLGLRCLSREFNAARVGNLAEVVGGALKSVQSESGGCS